MLSLLQYFLSIYEKSVGGKKLHPMSYDKKKKVCSLICELYLIFNIRKGAAFLTLIVIHF